MFLQMFADGVCGVCSVTHAGGVPTFWNWSEAVVPLWLLLEVLAPEPCSDKSVAAAAAAVAL